jgi:hypothetical protein
MKFSQFATLALVASLTLPMSVIAQNFESNSGEKRVSVTISDCMVKGPGLNNVQISQGHFIHLEFCKTNTFRGSSIAITVNPNTCLLKSGGKLVKDEYGNLLQLKGCTPKNK